MSLETPPRDPSTSEVASTTPRRPTLWRHRDFVKMWSAQTISQFGDEITQLACRWWRS